MLFRSGICAHAAMRKYLEEMSGEQLRALADGTGALHELITLLTTMG